MAQWILTGNGKVVPRRAICHSAKAKLAPSNETEQLKRTEFDATLTNRLGNSFTLPPTTYHDIVHTPGKKANPQGGDFDPYMDDQEPSAFETQADILDSAGNPILQKSFSDTMINAEVLLPHGEMNRLATGVKNSVNDNGKTI